MGGPKISIPESLSVKTVFLDILSFIFWSLLFGRKLETKNQANKWGV